MPTPDATLIQTLLMARPPFNSRTPVLFSPESRIVPLFMTVAPSLACNAVTFLPLPMMLPLLNTAPSPFSLMAPMLFSPFSHTSPKSP